MFYRDDHARRTDSTDGLVGALAYENVLGLIVNGLIGVVLLILTDVSLEEYIPIGLISILACAVTGVIGWLIIVVSPIRYSLLGRRATTLERLLAGVFTLAATASLHLEIRLYRVIKSSTSCSDSS